MTTAPTKPPPAPLDPPAFDREAYLRRIPKVRHAMMVLIPSKNPATGAKPDGRMVVTEAKETVTLGVCEVGSALLHEIELTPAEARELAHQLNVICERLRKRPSHRP